MEEIFKGILVAICIISIVLNIVLCGRISELKHTNTNITPIDSIEYNIKQIDSIEYNIIQRDSVIYKIKEVYEEKIKEAEHLSDDDAVKLFLVLVAK